jgi:hypothetical protein
MPDQPVLDRFKPDMPQIPGLSAQGTKPPKRSSNPFLLIGGLAALVLVLVIAGTWMFRSRPADTPAQTRPAPQIEVPTPPPDPTASFPHATEHNPQIATVADLAKAWSSQQFFFRNSVTGENVPGVIIRLPGEPGSQPSGYWALELKAPYGDCHLEYVDDLDKLKSDYDYRRATHPMVGNPCTRSVFDPLKLASMAGNVWVRGAIVQGSDVRPPLGVEIQIKEGRILAVRME